jgi:cytochrome c-type biogenesis protein CcmF
MLFIAAACLGLIVWRLPRLRGRTHIESMASREAMFVLNNWALLGIMTFILVFTLWPKISELFSGDTVTFGKPFFDRWIAPIGLVVFALMGLAPLFGWRKTSQVSLKRAFAFPLAAALVFAVAHVAFGTTLGFPAIVDSVSFDTGPSAAILGPIKMSLPLLTMTLVGFNVAVIAQEFYRGVKARQSSAQKRKESESVGVALYRLVAKSRRRYGGYTVHLGIICMFIGFVGQAWGIDKETSMMPGQTYQIGNFGITYEGPRMCPGSPKCSPEEQADLNKRMIFAELTVRRNGSYVATLDPAKFIYKRQPEAPTTEVSMYRSMREDLYTVVGTVNPQTKRATFQFHVNPLVGWIWVGVLVLIAGCSLSLWPEVRARELGVWAYIRAAGGATAGIALSIYLAMAPGSAYAQQRPDRPQVAEVSREQPRPARTEGVWAATGVGLGLGVLSVLWLSSRRRRATDGARF